MDALGALLFGQTRGSILRLLFGLPDQRRYARQIAREVDGSVGTVQRELRLLTSHGLIERTKIGSQVFYRANRSHPVYSELHSLIAKTVGVFQLLEAALAPLAARISLAFVYGSLARGEENAESDVDVLLVGDVTLDEVLARLAPVESAIGRSINPTVYSAQEFNAKLRSGNHFLKSVMGGDRVHLIGGADEPGEVG
jgi:predicted nucleotidyltransferase